MYITHSISWVRELLNYFSIPDVRQLENFGIAVGGGVDQLCYWTFKSIVGDHFEINE